MNNFSELSGSVFSWLEEKCKPQLLQEVMYDALNEVKGSYQQLQPQQQQQLGVQQQQQQQRQQLPMHLNQDLLSQMKTESK